ncbi:MAG: chorismate-binding protein [Solirubrobacteraceae bacterium]|nr:chorismate-binding protein [Solirubrobacteraceae bacterium]
MPAVADSQISPSRDEVSKLAATGDHGLVPLTHSFVDDLSTPVAAYLKLRAADPGSPSFLLESAEQAQQVGRYAFVGTRPKEVIRWSIGDDDRDPYGLVADLTEGARQARVDGLPPFTGGAVGMFGYDLVRTVETSLGAPQNPDPVGLPDLAIMLSDTLVVFDHLDRRTTILANADLTAAGGDANAAYEAAAEEIRRVRNILAGPIPVPDVAPREHTPLAWESNHTREQYETTVAKIVEYIHAGDAFQVVPSQRWTAPLPIEPFSVYRGLRAVNPSPYMYYLDFGDFQIVGASPEPLLRVKGRRVETYPVAGTRRRTGNPADDAELAAELLADEKERAEHIMLVDLGRNDLGRVSEYGSVVVDELMKIDTFSHLLHISSLVSGTLAEGVRPIDALRSTLPAGTLSGAPKVRAMEIIDELEPVKRSWYAGAVGYLAYGGDLDTCINIRSVVVKDGLVHAQTGGGTVADALPENEYEESVTKSLGTKRAIDLAVSQEDWA